LSDKVQDIRESLLPSVIKRYERGETMKDIASKANVSAPTVAKWLTEAGYKHKSKGRIPLAMKERVKDLHQRGWPKDEISSLLRLSDERVSGILGPSKNPILGGRDPLKIRAIQKEEAKKKKKKRSKRGRPPKEKKDPVSQWPPPRHKCRKHWNDDEKKYVVQLINDGLSPLEIYKRMRASRKRQIRIWRESGGKGMPPNFPPTKGPPTRPAELSKADAKDKKRLEQKSKEAKKRIKELEGEVKKKEQSIAALEQQEQLKIAALEEKVEAEQDRLRDLREKARTQKRMLEASAAILEKRKSLQEVPKPRTRRVLEGSYEAEALGLPVGSVIPKKKKKAKTGLQQYAPNGEYFEVSKRWPELDGATSDEARVFVAELNRRGVPAVLSKEGQYPSDIEGWLSDDREKFESVVDRTSQLLEKYKDLKKSLKGEGERSYVVRYLRSVYQAYVKKQKDQSVEQQRAIYGVEDAWRDMRREQRYIVSFKLGYAKVSKGPPAKRVGTESLSGSGDPTAKGIEASKALEASIKKKIAAKKEKEERKAREFAEKIERRQLAAKKEEEKRRAIAAKKEEEQRQAIAAATTPPLPPGEATDGTPTEDPNKAPDEEVF